MKNLYYVHRSGFIDGLHRERGDSLYMMPAAAKYLLLNGTIDSMPPDAQKNEPVPPATLDMKIR